MEKNLTIKDFKGYNLEALEEWNQGIYTEQELVELFKGELKPIYSKSKNPVDDLIPKYPKQNVLNYKPRK